MKKRDLIIKLIFVVISISLIIFLQNKSFAEEIDNNNILISQHEVIKEVNLFSSLNGIGDITTIDLTSLVTGGDVSHTHIYEKKYDTASHWEECFICKNKINIKSHSLANTGSNTCGSNLVTYCTGGCGYSISQYVDHDLVEIPVNKYPTNTVTYYHTIRECSKCGAASAVNTAGVSTAEVCVDSNGNLITCTNRGICAICKFDYSTTGYISHQSQDSVCSYCGKEIYKVLYETKLQDPSNNLHWSFKGIFKLSPEVKWSITEGLATHSPLYTTGALSQLTPATVTPLSSEYYNKSEYGTQGITTGLYMVEYDAYISDGYQGTISVRLNADNCFYNVNGVDNQYAKTYRMGFSISPDTVAPTVTGVNINRSEIVNNYSRKATITVNAHDNYSDIVEVALYNQKGECISNYSNAKNLGSGNFSISFDIADEIREKETMILKINYLV